MNKLKNIFKIGRKTKTISPKLIEAEFQGKKQPVFLYTPYGTFINPPNDLIVGLLADQGNEESLMGMVTDKVNREELEDGEVAFGIPTGKNRIYFRKDDSIEIQNEKSSVIIGADGSINITGAEEINIKSDANIIVDATANTTIKALGDLTLQTGDAVSWNPNILPACLFTGAPHGGVSGGIVKLKGG